jgi:hypothetical protein
VSAETSSLRSTVSPTISNARRLDAGYRRAVIWLFGAVFLLDGNEIIVSYGQIDKGLTATDSDTLQGFAMPPGDDLGNSGVGVCHKMCGFDGSNIDAGGSVESISRSRIRNMGNLTSNLRFVLSRVCDAFALFSLRALHLLSAGCAATG